ncbi:MAG: potassium-transporting ATPase subunit F [Acidiferrobacter sp.]
MTEGRMIDVLLALVIAVVAYLIYAILYPERF